VRNYSASRAERDSSQLTSVRRLVGPDVLVEGRAGLERTVLGTGNDVSVVDGGWSSRHDAGGRGAAAAAGARSVAAGGRVVGAVRRRRGGGGGRRHGGVVGVTRQASLVLAQQLGHGAVALLRRYVPSRRPVLRRANIIKNELQNSQTYAYSGVVMTC